MKHGRYDGKECGAISQQLDISPKWEARQYLRVVDCLTQQRGMGKAQQTEITKYISSPRDLTGLSEMIRESVGVSVIRPQPPSTGRFR